MKYLIVSLLIFTCMNSRAKEPVPADPKATKETASMFRYMLKLQS